MISREEANYSSNTACLIGYLQGYVKAYAAELEKDHSLWTKQEIASNLKRVVELSNKWFDVRYEGPFQPHEIEAMLKQEQA